ncbi:MAG: exo-alpha-sialidase [Chloroflexi bacterium]|nr:exo-alpha-sialidase [Chloroflexota bacterium]MBP8054482.1 exo-alpha-sialidase [Chloroflexota bacterium]
MKRLLLAIPLLILFLLWASPPGQSQNNTWSRPLRLGDGWFPDIVTDATGYVHLVYASAVGDSDNFKGYDVVMYTGSTDGVRWSPPNDIGARPQSAGSEVTRPYLVADARNRLHLTYRDTTVFYAQAPADLAGQAGSWSLKPINLGYFSVFGLDNQDRMHLLYTDNVVSDQCAICYHLFYRFSDNDGQSWSSATDVSTLPIGSAKPQLIIDEQDNLYLFWEAGIGGSYGQLVDPTVVLFSFSTDRGETWSLPSQLSADGERARHPGLGLDGEGNLVVVWLNPQTDLVHYRISGDGGRTWTAAAAIPHIWGGWSIYPGRLDHYVMAADSQGHLHLVLVGRTSANQSSLDLLHLTWDGSAWSDPEIIASFYGDVPEWPEITIANGQELHVTWFIRPEAYIWSGGFGSQVWYAHRLLDVPRVEEVFLPTLTPPPATPTAELLTTPTVVPLSAAGAQTESLGFYGDITTENDDVFLIFQSLVLPLLFIMGATFIIRQFQK